MTRMFLATALLLTLALGAGCAMCENPFDYEYSAFGGICADGACGRRAGSIVSGPCGETVGEVVVSKEEFPESFQPMPAGPNPATPLEAPPEEERPLEFEPDTSILPDDGATRSLDPPTPDPDLLRHIETGPAEVESEGMEAPWPADAGDSGLLPLGPAEAPPVPGNTGAGN